MDMERWREFVMLAEEKSFSKTAEALNMTQSALSKHIMALEKELGLQLFDRGSKSVELTEAGQRLLPNAKELCRQIEQITRAAAGLKGPGQSAAKIASIPVMAQYGIIDIVSDFSKKYQYAGIQVYECESRDILKKLAGGEFDLAFARGADSEDFEYKEICLDRLVAVLPKGHPLSGEKKLTAGQLKDENFVFMDSETSIYDLSVKLCRDAGFEPKVKYLGHRPENLIEMVSGGMGVAFLMKRHTEYLPRQGTVAVEIEPAVEVGIYLAKPKNSRLPESGKLFWRYVSEK